MEDTQIIALYWERSEQAIEETAQKYGGYCRAVAYRILQNSEDTEECLNDTLEGAWSGIPPARPANLKAYLAKIIRNIALDRFDRKAAAKRSAETTMVLDEFWECVPDSRQSIEDTLAFKESVNRFLTGLSQRDRTLFLQRYWYLCSIKELADRFSLTESNVKAVLYRTRERFKHHLEKEELFV